MVSESEYVEPGLVLAKTAELVGSVSLGVLSASLGSHWSFPPHFAMPHLLSHPSLNPQEHHWMLLPSLKTLHGS